MVHRLSIYLSALLTLIAFLMAADCAHMCIMGGSVMHMNCWLARMMGWNCDPGMLIALMTCTMAGSAATALLCVTPRRPSVARRWTKP